MSPIHSGRIRLVLMALAFYTMFAQPGLPACWMEQQPCKFHPHFSDAQAESPHDHNFLFDQVLGQAAPASLSLLLPAAALLWMLMMMGLLPFRKESPDYFSVARWLALPEPPPPKFMARFA
jgi:hypothetical protein